MYNNVGRTIKILAKVLLGVGIGITILIWMVCLFKASSESTEFTDGYMFMGIATLIFGSLLSWVNSILLYGFGSLIDNSRMIANNTAIIADYNTLLSEDAVEAMDAVDESQYAD